MRNNKVLKTREISTEEQLPSSHINIMDLPPEVMLEIFSLLSMRDLWECVVPVCEKWGIIARHPSIWKEFLLDDDIPKSSALEILHAAPLLRRLSLKDRRDTDAILQQVCESNRNIETLEMDNCRGSVETHELNGDILVRILIECPKLCCLNIERTLVNSCEFFTVLASLDERMKSFRILEGTREGMLCYLKGRSQLPVQQRGFLNEECKEVEEMIGVMSGNSGINSWEFVFTN